MKTKDEYIRRMAPAKPGDILRIADIGDGFTVRDQTNPRTSHELKGLWVVVAQNHGLSLTVDVHNQHWEDAILKLSKSGYNMADLVGQTTLPNGFFLPFPVSRVRPLLQEKGKFTTIVAEPVEAAL